MIDLILPWDADHEYFRSTDQTFSEKLNNGGSYKYLSIADKSGYRLQKLKAYSF